MLEQVRPTTTTAQAALTATTRRVTVDAITICNVGDVAATFRIFFARKTPTYNENTAIFWNVALAIGETKAYDVKCRLITTGDSIGVQSSEANGITFTLEGKYKS